jgi:hypothetical protein
MLPICMVNEETLAQIPEDVRLYLRVVRDHGANCVERNGKGLCKAQGGRRPDQVGRRPLGEVSLGRRFRR